MKATSSVPTLRKNGFSLLNTNVCSIQHKLPFTCDGYPAKFQSNGNYRFDIKMHQPGFTKISVVVSFLVSDSL